MLDSIGNKEKSRISGKEVGVMLIGAGAVADCHLDYICKSKKVKLIAIADTDIEAHKKIKHKYEYARVVFDYKEILQSDDIDIVLVCTPHYLHYAMVLDALNSGKHVICEKPMSISIKEADEMIDAAESNQKRLFVALNMRFFPWVLKISELLANEDIGRIVAGNSLYLGYEVDRLNDANCWKGDLIKAGGGVLVDGGFHIVDLMNSWMGTARSVQAIGGKFIIDAENKGEDNIMLQIEYDSGAIASLQASFTAISPSCDKEPTIVLEHKLFGTEGSIYCGYSWDPINGTNKYLNVVKLDGRRSINLDDVVSMNQFDHFLDCLINNKEPIVNAIDARNTSAVVEAAYSSILTGKKTEVNWRSNDS